ncbi:MAG: hypothetical protein AAF921_26745 [Cyanobacteria bacterium P01_D01_bin.44]
MLSATKVKAKRVKTPSAKGSKTAVVTAFEKALHLETLAKISVKGREASCFLLAKGKKFQLVFGFECNGIHDNPKEHQLEAIATAVESGLKDVSMGSATFHLESFSSDLDRQNYLDRLIQTSDCLEAQVVLYSEKKRAQELVVKGVRQVKRLTVYVEATIDFNDVGEGEKADWSDKAISQVAKFWKSIQKVTDGKDARQDEFEALFESGFYRGFIFWEQILSNRMGLEITPLDTEELWQRIWQRFNTGPAPSVPQWIEYKDGEITEIIHSDKHPRSILTAGEGGESRVPIADTDWVKVKDKFVAPMVFAEKPEGFASVRQQLRFLWEAICKPYVKDTEIITQVQPTNLKLMQHKMQDVIKQSVARSQFAQEKTSVDVNAGLRLKKSIEAQERLYEGTIPVRLGTVVLVHRDRKSKLDDACRGLANCFPLPCRLVRERDVPWHYWLQTLPIVWDQILKVPYDRTSTWLSNEALGMLPICKTKDIDREGFELIADDGGSPIKLDFINKLRNVACFGTTRSGKSVLVSGMLSLFLSSGYPIIALDYPKPDGTSTFTDFAVYYGDRAAYFDIGKESNNLMEIPDLQGLSEKEAEERFDDYKAFLESALLAMVRGDSREERALIGKALNNFFADKDIMRRYDEAFENGFGSMEWQVMPTLKDFLDFCSEESLGMDEDSSILQRNAREQIQLQIEYWIGSRIGRAIAKPSSFPTDSQLIVFALRNLANDEEAALLALSAYSAALRRALKSPKSIFFIDESPILFEYPSIAGLIGRLCANGAKAGIRVFLSAQDPNTIMESHAGPKIMQNMNTKLIGRIQENAIDAFVRYLRYEEDMISRNASERFYPKASDLYSNWMLETDGVIFYCRYYPSDLQLAIVANNTDEQAARNRFMEKASNRLEGYVRFSEEYANCIRNGLSLEDIGR